LQHSEVLAECDALSEAARRDDEDNVAPRGLGERRKHANPGDLLPTLLAELLRATLDVGGS
jgi:hypothetical protein